jgi:membrane protein
MAGVQRAINWVLGGLAVGVALRAAAPRRRQPATGPPVPANPPVGQPAQAVATAATAPARDGDTASPQLADHAKAAANHSVGFLKELGAEIKKDNIPMISAALSYYALFAVFPAAIAALSIYGLWLDEVQLEQVIEDLTTQLPGEAASLIGQQLTGLVSRSSTQLGVSAVVSILVALWSASAGTKSLIRGLNIAYDVDEQRPFAHQRALAYGLTVGMILFLVVAVASVTFLDEWLNSIDLPGTATVVQWSSWPAVLLVVVLGLGLLYKVAPNRPSSRSPWISPGAIVATVAWMAVTVGLSIYTARLATFSATYGALTGVVVLMLWFFASGFAVLLGAETNDIIERRRRRRTGA